MISKGILIMEKFNIKRMYGYYWMIISLAIQLFVFLLFLGLTFYFKSFDISNAVNKEVANEVIIIFIILDIIIVLIFVCSISIYLYLFLPFKNSTGKIISVKICEKSLFSTMYGMIEINGYKQMVKIKFVSRSFINYYACYYVGDYVDCFIREQDLSNPKTVILYR